MQPGGSSGGQLLGGLPCRLLRPLSPCGVLEGQASQGFRGHLHGSGAWPGLQAQSTSVQHLGWRLVALASPRKPCSCHWSVRALRPAQTRGRDVGARPAMTARAVCLGRGCCAVSAQQTRSSRVRSFTRWNTGFGSAPRLPSRAGRREEAAAGVTVAHGEERGTRGSGVPLPRGPEPRGRLCGVRAGNRAPSVSSRGSWLPGGGPSLAPPVLRAHHRSSLASPPESREEPQRAFLHLL